MNYRILITGSEGLIGKAPWVLFTSSREVYGQPDDLPATEATALRPMNVYGRSKVAGEQIAQAALRRGLRTAVVWLANVYGATGDHVDRVVPTFSGDCSEWTAPVTPSISRI